MSHAHHLENRNLMLGEEITNLSVKVLIEKIYAINKEDELREKGVVGYDRYQRPIIITINTVGGSIYAGLALIGAMEMSKTPIHTVAVGLIASMGIPVFVSGHKRFTHRLATFMYHDVSYGHYGTMATHERKAEVTIKLRDKVNELILERTNMRLEDMEKYFDRVEDWFFDADEAIKLGVAENKLVMHRLKKSDIDSGNFVVEK